MAKQKMSVVLDLGANIECSSKFNYFWVVYYIKFYLIQRNQVALSRKLKRNAIKDTYQLLTDNKNTLFDIKFIVADNFDNIAKNSGNSSNL